ncbi:MAG TPA: phosphatase PAP2 family protein, partial [Acidimicrobiia bacterium]|nr:phosphatase PAP2 family protein [Acidimicrobiia bacterium]
FYGSLHFIVTIGAALFLYRWFADDYPRFRNTLATTTALALVGFVLFPLAPPRLMDGFGFVDTLAEYPTFWSFNSGAVSKVSNQYAAMPSVHCAWALWCALVFVPRVRPPALKVLAALYPALTVVVIVVTGNHYWLDAVGGFLVLGVGYTIAHLLTRAGRAQPDPADAAPTNEPSLVES